MTKGKPRRKERKELILASILIWIKRYASSRYYNYASTVISVCKFRRKPKLLSDDRSESSLIALLSQKKLFADLHE